MKGTIAQNPFPRGGGNEIGREETGREAASPVCLGRGGKIDQENEAIGLLVANHVPRSLRAARPDNRAAQRTAALTPRAVFP
ncbi:hypothetical protein [Burkholderia plantarii]|uniref:hypothetical protein n=1 Tax=Burkholderia plantarii TaxID=41899 RepID=UPI0011DF4BC2|nr:hypothetical protein [Burkholderia plantarii]